MIRRKPILGLLIILAVLTMVVLDQLLKALNMPVWFLALVAISESVLFAFSLVRVGRIN